MVSAEMRHDKKIGLSHRCGKFTAVGEHSTTKSTLLLFNDPCHVDKAKGKVFLHYVGKKLYLARIFGDNIKNYYYSSCSAVFVATQNRNYHVGWLP